MVSCEKYKKLVLAKSKLPENKSCIDCGADNPQWASARYGTFFCLDCAALHRSLGLYLDYVRSVVLDKWDEACYLPVEHGGNTKFLDYLKKHGLEKLSFESKYRHCKVIQYTKILMDEIYDKTGVILECSTMKEHNNTSDSGLRRERAVELKKFESMSEMASVDKKSDNIYGNKKFSTSLSNITSLLGDKVKNITEKTVEYGVKLGSTVKLHTKHIIEKSSAAVSSMRSDKSHGAKKPSTTTGYQTVNKKSQRSKDWS